MSKINVFLLQITNLYQNFVLKISVTFLAYSVTDFNTEALNSKSIQTAKMSISIPTLSLNTGFKMPVLGLGTWKVIITYYRPSLLFFDAIHNKYLLPRANRDKSLERLVLR